MSKDEIDVGFRELQLNANLLQMDVPDWFPGARKRGQLEKFIFWVLLVHGRAPQAALMRAMNRTNWPFSSRIYDLKPMAQEQICWDLATTLTMTMDLPGSKTKDLTDSIKGLVSAEKDGSDWATLARKLQEDVK